MPTVLIVSRPSSSFVCLDFKTNFSVFSLIAQLMILFEYCVGSVFGPLMCDFCGFFLT